MRLTAVVRFFDSHKHNFVIRAFGNIQLVVPKVHDYIRECVWTVFSVALSHRNRSKEGLTEFALCVVILEIVKFPDEHNNTSVIP